MQTDSHGTCNPLTIAGLPTSGKSTIAALLDGHSSVITGHNLFFHDCVSCFLPELHSRYDDPSTVVAESMGYSKRSYFLRMMLIKHSSFYFTIENLLNSREFKFFLSSEESVSLPVPSVGDFYALDRRIMEAFEAIDIQSPAQLFRVFWTNFFKSIEGIDCSKVIYCSSMAPNGFSDFETLLHSYPNGKILFMNRSLEEAIGASFLREAVLTKKSFAEVLLRMQSSETAHWINNIYISQQKALLLAKKYPEKFMVVDFENLFIDFKKNMNAILQWISLPILPIFEKYSFFGHSFGDTTYFSIQDNIEDRLSANDFSQLSQFIASCIKGDYQENKRQGFTYLRRVAGSIKRKIMR
ncbi:MULTISPECIES: sulfotransferase [Desulfovibrio]|uniref:Sulfotransferase domain-containing protein n=1 Tax=Desulfovibrio desulfuricans TaxID=876 RepID=A0AA94L3K9_DESDE|nr:MULTISPECIES: sulfotransferase [Desulfovibrio]SFW74419.1 hypothetical protein SAMN02910291_02872 [Desulfovibrio desulfuricans]SPD34846.1 Sulfotransferase family [Desulfovibrio sp. G11]